MVLLFKKLRPSVTDDSVNYIHFESDCVVHPKHSFDSAGILHLIAFFSFILQKLCFMQTSLTVFIIAMCSLSVLSFVVFIFDF